MNGGTLVKVPTEVASIPKDQIKWGEIMLVDPRDYLVSDYNARLYDKERNIKALEDSILSTGFRNPILVDDNKRVIDGSRRLHIALKHGLMLPAIHIVYSKDIRDPELMSAVDSILFNSAEPNTPRELGDTIRKVSKKSGIPMSKLSEMLGIPWSIINNWAQQVSIPEDVIPAEMQTPEVKEAWEGMSSRKREVVTRVAKSIEGTPREKADTAMKLVEAGYDKLDNISRDINDGVKVNIKDRTAGDGVKKIVYNVELIPPMSALLTQKSKARTWDSNIALKACLWQWLIGETELTQDVYDRFRAAEKEHFDGSNKK